MLFRWLHRRGARPAQAEVDAARPAPLAVVPPAAELPGDAAAAAVQSRGAEPPEALWAAAFTQSAHGIAITDALSGELLTLNAAYARLVGCAAEELQGRPSVSIYPASEHARLLAAEQESDLSGSATLETCQIHHDGTLIPVEVSVVALRDVRGRVRHRLQTVSDRRAQLRAEGELRHSEARETAAARFRQLAESAPVGILLMDADGACDYANPCWQQITGLAPGQAREEGWWEAVHADDRERLSDAWERLARGTPLDLEFRYRRGNGEIRWVHSRAAALRDESGATVGYLGVDVDITEQLQQRAAVDGFHERVRALAQRLEHLREDERTELARKLHGSLRQDMTTLKVEIDTLRNGPQAADAVPPALPRVAELAERCLQSLRHIAFELQPPGVEDLGLAAAMKRFADECAVEAGLRIEIAAASNLPELGRRRSLALYRTFQEALTNVVRHARATRIEVQVWWQDGAVRLRIVDDGVGMGDKDRSKPGCFGLLSTSERLAELGGTLRVFGVAGRGTTLDASLPCERGNRQRDSAER